MLRRELVAAGLGPAALAFVLALDLLPPLPVVGLREGTAVGHERSTDSALVRPVPDSLPGGSAPTADAEGRPRPMALAAGSGPVLPGLPQDLYNGLHRYIWYPHPLCKSIPGVFQGVSVYRQNHVTAYKATRGALGALYSLLFHCFSVTRDMIVREGEYEGDTGIAALDFRHKKLAYPSKNRNTETFVTSCQPTYCLAIRRNKW